MLDYGFTRIESPQIRDRALDHARGSYQRDLVMGLESISGSTLQGKAGQWGGKYAHSRDRLLERLDRIGIKVGRATDHKGRRVLVLGDVPPVATDRTAK